MKRKRRQRKVYKDTSIELKTEEALKILGVEYIKQYDVPEILTVDFYLPEHNLIIEVDGCYWHNCPEHYPNNHKKKRGIDLVRTEMMRLSGYKVLRIWEHDINAMTISELSLLLSNKL